MQNLEATKKFTSLRLTVCTLEKHVLPPWGFAAEVLSCSALLEATHVLGVCLGVVLLKDCGVLGQQTGLLLLDDGALASLLLLLILLLGLLGLPLRLIDR